MVKKQFGSTNLSQETQVQVLAYVTTGSEMEVSKDLCKEFACWFCLHPIASHKTSPKSGSKKNLI